MATAAFEAQIKQKNINKTIAIFNAQIAQLIIDNRAKASDVAELLMDYRDCYKFLTTDLSDEELNDPELDEQLNSIVTKAHALYKKYKTRAACKRDLWLYFLVFIIIIFAINLGIKMFSIFYPESIVTLKPLLTKISVAASITAGFLLLPALIITRQISDTQIEKEKKILADLKEELFGEIFY